MTSAWAGFSTSISLVSRLTLDASRSGASQPIDPRVSQDPHEPRLGVDPVAEAVDGRERLEQGVLRQVVGLGFVSAPASAAQEHVGSVRPDQLVKTIAQRSREAGLRLSKTKEQ